MSKKNPGGFISSTAVRTPDPTDETQYSGVWSMPEQYQAARAGDWANPSGQTHEIRNSLKIGNGDTLNVGLLRNISTSGDRRCWTYSGWVKRGTAGSGDSNAPWGGGATSGNPAPYEGLRFSSNQLQYYIGMNSNTVYASLVSNEYYRDTSAWYHLVMVWDTRQANQYDRCKLYVNGELSTLTGTWPSQNVESLAINRQYSDGVWNVIGGWYLQASGGMVGPLNGFITEVNFIDGQALSADYFGYFDYNGVWQPKKYEGSYGKNGFYLPFRNDIPFYTSHINDNGEFDVTGDGQLYRYAGNDSGGYWNETVISGDFDIYWKYDAASGSVSPGDAYVIGVVDANTKWNFNSSIIGGNLTNVFYTQYGSAGFYTRAYVNGSETDSLTSGTNPSTTSYVRISRSGSTISIHQGTTPGTWTLIKTFTGTFSGDVRWFFGSGNKDQDVRVNNITFKTINGKTDGYKGFIAEERLGYDRSGNGNHWQVSDLSIADTFRDSPTNGSPLEDTGLGGQLSGNYCIWNYNWSRYWGGTYPVTAAGLRMADSSDYNSGAATWAMGTGKWYWEIKVTTSNNTYNAHIGVQDAALRGNGSVSAYPASNAAYPFGFNTYRNDGQKSITLTEGAGTTLASYGASWTTGDIIGVALDMDASPPTIQFYKNGSAQGSINLLAGKDYVPVVGDEANAGNYVFDANFGQAPYVYPAPSGYKVLCTAHLNAPVGDGSKYFDIVTWAGRTTGSVYDVNGFKFKPDFIWTKTTNQTYSHWLQDSVRGIGLGNENTLSTNSTNKEADTSGLATAFTDTGFSITTAGSTSAGNSLVTWAWKLGGAPTAGAQYMRDGESFTPTQGTVPIQKMSVNTKSGISIFSYTSNGASTQTIGHGLGVQPEVIIIRAIDRDGERWPTWHQAMGTGYTAINELNVYSYASTVFQNASFSDSVIAVGNNASVGLSGTSYLVYAFKGIPGFSKFGYFTGGATADSSFIYLGFRPRYFMFKRFDSTGDWVIMDTQRTPTNQMLGFLYAEVYNIQATNGYAMDFLSNGVKVRDTAGNVAAGAKYLYLAFAEHPFKTARAR